MLFRHTPLILLAITLGASATARSKRMMPRQVPADIPLDLREVVSDPGVGEVATLKPFKVQPHLTGSTIALTHDERFLVVADRENNAVVVLDPNTRTVRHTVLVGRGPERLVVSDDNLAYVTCRFGRSVDIVDIRRGAVVSSISAGVEPYGVALTPDQETLLVTSSATGELIAVARRTMRERFRLQLDAWPAAVTAHPNGRQAFVSHFHGAGVDVIDLKTERRTKSLTLPSGHSGHANRLLFARKESRKPNYAVAATVSPGGTRLFVSHTMVDTGSTRPVSVSVGGYGVDVSLPIVASVTSFDLRTGEVLRPERGRTVANSSRFQKLNQANMAMRGISQPMAIAHHPGQALLFMVAMGSDTVLAFDTRTKDPLVRPVARLKTGHAPLGLAISRTGSVFVHNSHSFDVAVFDVAPKATRVVPHLQPSHRFAYGRDPLPADVARGRRLFFAANDTRIGGPSAFACASCHMDGRADGLVWSSGSGPRQTPILAGRLDGTGPYNWLGTESALEDNIHKTIGRLGGSGIKPQESQDLARYISRYLPRLDNPNPTGTAEVALGRKLFHDADVGCSSCHTSNQRFTDGLLHDVGTTTDREKQLWKQQANLRRQVQNQKQNFGRRVVMLAAEPPIAYNTPGLRHVWASGPYYHDGSSKTLRDVITTGNRGDRMGKTSHLASAEVDALVAYVKTL